MLICYIWQHISMIKCWLIFWLVNVKFSDFLNAKNFGYGHQMLKDILSNFVEFYSIPLSSHIVLLFLLSHSQISLRPRRGDGFCNCDCEWVRRWWHFLFLKTLSVTFSTASFSFPLLQNQKQSWYVFFFCSFFNFSE